MTLDDAIKALQVAREVLGGDALLGMSVPGLKGFTTPDVSFSGPCEMDLARGKYAIVLVGQDPELKWQPPAGFCGVITKGST